MRNLLLVVLCGAVLASCGTFKNVSHVGTCMGNSDIAQAFQGPGKAAYADTVMVGGLGMDGRVDCYWSETGKKNDPALSSEAWQLCARDNKMRCTVLADRGHIFVREPSLPSISPSYELFGQFAPSFATPRHHIGGAPEPGTLHCSSPLVGVMGDPFYVCQ